MIFFLAKAVTELEQYPKASFPCDLGQDIVLLYSIPILFSLLLSFLSYYASSS